MTTFAAAPTVQVRTRRPDSGRRGFALPMTVFLVTLLTLLLATGFARVRADRQIAVGSEYTTDALAIAQSGLQKYLGTQVTRPADGDSVPIIDIPGGYAMVVARVAQRPADTLLPETFIIRSTGYAIEPSVSSEPLAQRTVAQFATWQVGYMEAGAALTALNEVRRRPGGGNPSLLSANDTISGLDACTVTPQPPVRSAWTPDYIPHPTNEDGIPVAFEPGQPDESVPVIGIDWASAMGPGIIPDYTSIQVDSDEWTVQRVVGNATLSSGSGTGLLIVTGSLAFGGSHARWEGVILVGRELFFGATYNRIEGLVVTGLQGGVTQETDFGWADRETVIRYNSCFVLQALAPLTGFRTISNTWIDNWATY